jgi:putative ABC transport system permease protein
VCVIGETVRRELFGKNGDPIGRDIQVGDVTLTVVGVLAARGKMFNQDMDKVVLLAGHDGPETLCGQRYG